MFLPCCVVFPLGKNALFITFLSRIAPIAVGRRQLQSTFKKNFVPQICDRFRRIHNTTAGLPKF
jgi:hypothetical protein